MKLLASFAIGAVLGVLTCYSRVRDLAARYRRLDGAMNCVARAYEFYIATLDPKSPVGQDPTWAAMAHTQFLLDIALALTTDRKDPGPA